MPAKNNICPDCGATVGRQAVRCKPCAYREISRRTDERHASAPGPNPEGLCLCGCGNPTPLATGKRFPGKPVRYIVGHGTRSAPYPDAPYTVDERTGCWEWSFVRDRNGYGYLTIDRRTVKAHRFYYEMAVAPISPGMHIDHLCKNTSCVNPEHLEVVTPAENARRRSTTRLTRADVDTIRSLAGTIPQGEIASRFGISPGYVSTLIKGNKWRD